MYFYNLSESRIKRILRFPKRTEEGIALDTIAMMQLAGTAKNPYEIWVMIQKIEADKSGLDKNNISGLMRNKIKIISVWKYPGKTKPRSEALLNILNSEYNEYDS